MSSKKTDYLKMHDWTEADPWRLAEVSENFKKMDKKAKDLDTSMAATVSTAADAKMTATGIDAKATEALAKSTEAVQNVSTAVQKANSAETKATEAKTVSDNALAKAGAAESIANGVQTQFNQVVIAGDSSVEAAQARVNTSGQTYSTLKQRLDSEHQEVTVKLADTGKNLETLVPKKHVFGGQIERLKESLSNPLEQYLSLVFIADSIGWGMAVPGNPSVTPRDGTLSDVRDLFASASFVNEFKRYIGSKYGFGATPILSNWSASPSGESIVEYSKDHIMFPYQGDFTNDYTNPVNNPPIVGSSPSSVSNMQLTLNVANTQAGSHRLAFNFTGTEFTLYYSSVPSSMKYEIFVDGVSKGIFDTAPGVEGSVAGYNNQRKHTFGYVKNKLIEIKTVLGSYVGTNALKIDGIKFTKKIRISNQGIIGTSAMVYKSRNLEGNTNGDGSAVEASDRYVFIQLGTNDRVITAGYAKGTNEFKKNLAGIVDFLSPGRELILMAANPVANEVTTTYSFNMQDVRNTVYRVAKEKNVDFIDNYSVFANRLTTEFTADGTHPNVFGHKVIAQNIINSLEFN